MKVFWRIIALLTAVAAPALGQLPGPEVQRGPVAVTIDSVALKDLSSDRIRFDVVARVTSTRKLKIKRVRFEQMHLGEVPVYLRPIEDAIELEKDVPVTLPAVPMTVFFRDLDSLQPLQQMVRDEQAGVNGNARVDLDLNFLERLVGGPGITRGEVPLNVTAPIEIPGGILGQAAALATLSAAQVALDLGGSELNALRQEQKSWEADLRTRYTPALVVSRAKYTLVLKNKQHENFTVTGLGFRIAPDKFVLTGEMIEPWKYDPQVEAALRSGDATLSQEDRDLLVWPVGESLTEGSGRSLAKGAIQIEHAPVKTESALVVSNEKDRKVKLLPRDSDTNYAVLRFTRPEDKGPVMPASTPATPAQSWERVIVFRADDHGKLEFIPTPAHLMDKRIQFDDPVDERAFGSLIVSPQGAVGMVQEENGGMPLRTNW